MPDFNYLICSKSWNEWVFEKTDHSNHSNEQFLLGFIFFCTLSRSCYQLLTPWNIQSALTEGDRRRLPVAPFQNKQLTVALGIAKWQTVVLLLSMLHTTLGMANMSSWFPVFVLIVLLVVAALFVAVYSDGRTKVMLIGGTMWNWSSVSIAEPDSSSARLFVNSALRTAVIIYWVQSTNMCKTGLIYSNAEKNDF